MDNKDYKLYQFKQELNRVFDDNLHTKQWHNIVDYVIIGLIIISTLEVFASTFPGAEQQFGGLLKFIDIFTTIVFTIEVTLRIWNADMLDPKYKGFWGRVRYCFSFYGLIDILSTYPFYVSLIFPLPYTALKVLRVARLLRVFRYMHSFRLLSAAIQSKKSELWVSLQFLTIVTVILSFILYFVEHNVQPEVYTNGWDSVVWAFLQYVGDPGGFADYPPVTIAGQVIAVLVGVLGIAIFAVPAYQAQAVCDQLVESGILAIWNFVFTLLHVPQGILVKNENLPSSLAVLSHQLAKEMNKDRRNNNTLKE